MLKTVSMPIIVKMERVARWAQRKEPNPQTTIYEYLGAWGETPTLTKRAQRVGIYFGSGLVATLVAVPEN